jgi:hypothetical protein
MSTPIRSARYAALFSSSLSLLLISSHPAPFQPAPAAAVNRPRRPTAVAAVAAAAALLKKPSSGTDDDV